MLGGVTCHMLPYLPGVPHLHVNRPLKNNLSFWDGVNYHLFVDDDDDDSGGIVDDGDGFDSIKENG